MPAQSVQGMAHSGLGEADRGGPPGDAAVNHQRTKDYQEI